MAQDKLILLVEDNPDDVDLTLRALKKNNVVNEVVVTHDGVEALEYLHREGSRLPEVVLLDLKLPRLDGLELLQRIRAEPRTRRLPVVVLTSSTEERDLIASYERGCNSFIKKPVDFAQFLEAVRQLGLYWLVLNIGAPSAAPASDTRR